MKHKIIINYNFVLSSIELSIASQIVDSWSCFPPRNKNHQKYWRTQIVILPYLRAGPHHVHCVSPSEKEGRVVVGSRGRGRTPQHKETSEMISSYRIPPRKKHFSCTASSRCSIWDLKKCEIDVGVAEGHEYERQKSGHSPMRHCCPHAEMSLSLCCILYIYFILNMQHITTVA